MVVFQNLLLFFPFSKFPAKSLGSSTNSLKTVNHVPWCPEPVPWSSCSCLSSPLLPGRAVSTVGAGLSVRHAGQPVCRAHGRKPRGAQTAPPQSARASSPSPTPEAAALRCTVTGLAHCLWGSRLKRKGVPTCGGCGLGLPRPATRATAGSVLAGGCGHTVRCRPPCPRPLPRDGRSTLRRQL